MVWWTRKVCEEASHNRFASLSLPSQLPTNIENTLGYAPRSSLSRAPQTSLACKGDPEADRYRICHRLCVFHLPRVQKRAGGGFLPPPPLRYSSRISMVLPLPHLPRMQKRDGGGLFSHFVGAAPSSISLVCQVSQMWTPAFSISLTCKSEPGVDF
jgi:hypothetical protein